MNRLRKLLLVMSGWLVGLTFALAWVWIGEGKAGPSQTGGLYIVLTIISSVLSAILAGTTFIYLVGYMLDGEGK